MGPLTGADLSSRLRLAAAELRASGLWPAAAETCLEAARVLDGPGGELGEAITRVRTRVLPGLRAHRGADQAPGRSDHLDGHIAALERVLAAAEGRAR